MDELKIKFMIEEIKRITTEEFKTSGEITDPAKRLEDVLEMTMAVAMIKDITTYMAGAPASVCARVARILSQYYAAVDGLTKK